MDKKIRVFEAFAGYGSQSIALRNIGVPYEVVAISEIDKYAIKAYEAIHGVVNNLGDISKIKVEDIPEHDLFTYSFPCQDISIAGKQASLEEGSETRSSLLWECKKVIESKKPKYLLMENVKNLISKKHKPYFDKWLEYLDELGYTNYWQVLNAKDFDVPQNRERVFVVSILGKHKHYEFPKGLKLEKKIRDMLERETNEELFLHDTWEPVAKNGKSVCKQVGIYSPGNFEQSKRIYSIDYCCPTLTTMRGKGRVPKILINNHIRVLSSRECFRLMGVNDLDIDKIQSSPEITIPQQYKMAGNSIVVQVLEHIFKELLL